MPHDWKALAVIMDGGGRTGNLMFQHACALGLEARGVRAYLQLSHFGGRGRRLRQAFPGIEWEEPADDGWKWLPLFFEEDILKALQSPLAAMRCGGYFMWEGFFADAADEVRRAFRFDESAPALAEAVRRIEGDEGAVAVHVRRTDYLDPERAGIYGGICTPEYYRSALGLVRSLAGRPVTPHVFSDDLAWCREAFAGEGAVFEDLRAEEGYRDWWDMCLMSHCRHSVIANSSFSWWGAWLGAHPGKRVVCPARWDNLGQARSGTDRIRAAGWTAVDERGEVLG